MSRSAVVGAQWLRAGIVVGVALALLVLGAPAAKAATPINSYAFLASFGDGGGFAFNQQYGAVAVDGGTGNILVAESLSGQGGGPPAVQVYAPDAAAGGVPLTSILVSSQASGVAVDQANGSLYVSASSGVSRYLSDGAAVPTYTLDAGFAQPVSPTLFPTGLAVDPTTHDILVGDYSSGRVSRIDATGAIVSSFDGSNTFRGRFTGLGALAVGPTGTVYVVDTLGDNTGRIERFSPAGASLGTLPIPAGSAASSIAVNPQTGEVAVVIVDHGQTFIDGFTAAGQPAFSEHVAPQGNVAPGPVGMAWDAGSDRLYVNVNIDGLSGTVNTFVPATQPGLDPPVATQVTARGAHLTADVARGGVAGQARIEYCLSTAACSDYPVSDPAGPPNPWVRLSDHSLPDLSNPPSGGVDTISDDLSGLSPNSNYLVRSSAETGPTENRSATVTVHTLLVPPLVQTGRAGAVTDGGATLTGTIDTYGAQTVYHFEYGLTTNYGTRAPAGADGVAGNSRTPRTFSRTITGLQSGTTYHFRIVADNAAGTSVGADHTFTTQGRDEVAPRRGYEQVSPVDKRGATISARGFQAAADGSGLVYAVDGASTDSDSAPLTPRYVSRRGGASWLDWQPVDPPLSVSRLIIDSATQAISPDFDHALVASNRVLAPGAAEGGGNLYVRDLQTGGYTFVAAGNGLGSYIGMVGPANLYMYLAGARDFSWLVLASQPSLLSGVTHPALYKWTRAGGLELLSHLPDGSVPNGDVATHGGLAAAIPQASADGATTYFAFLPSSPGQQGVYRNTNGQTTAISVSQISGDPATPLPGALDATSRDGRYAIFRSGRLTPDAPVTNSFMIPADLYQYDSTNEHLTYIGSVNSTDEGRVLAVSDDAQTVYYNTASGTAVWRHGLVRLVTTDHPDLSADAFQAFASTDGRFLAYLGSDGDAHLYDADTDQSACVSCRSDGSVGGTAHLGEGTRSLSNRTAQVVTNNGDVFFDTTVPLISADHNGTADVYAYRDGHVTLISPGDGNFAARFIDATPDGRSIFFRTAEALVGQDTDQALDMYVARVGGGFPSQSPAAPPASCAKSECFEGGAGPVVSPPVVAPPQPPGPSKPRSNQQRVTLTLTSASFGSKSVRIRFHASQRGRVKVTGSRVSTTVRNVSKAGTYSITVPLSKKAQVLRRAHKKFKVSVKVSLSGGWGSASAKYSRTLGK